MKSKKITNKMRKTKKIGGFSYPKIKLSLHGHKVPCSTCKSNEYYKIDTSVPRSKTAGIAMNLIFGDEANPSLNHPLRCYVCTKCITCKFVYAPTKWNGLDVPIKETQMN